MREAIGGTWLFGIVALFIVLFSGFLAYSISYTKAFNTKNYILTLIEQNEGFTEARTICHKSLGIIKSSTSELENCNATDAIVYKYITSHGYNPVEVDCSKGDYGTFIDGGYCIKKICNSRNSSSVYKVTTFIKITLPVINVTMKLPVTGETKTLYHEATNSFNHCS